MILEFFQNPWLYGVIVAFLILGIGNTFFRKLPVTKNQLMIIALIGLFITSFGLDALGMGAVGINGGYDTGWSVTGLQTTTAYAVSSQVADVSDTGTDDTRKSVFYVNETQLSSNAVLDDGIMLITRSGELTAGSCDVRVIKPAQYSIANNDYDLLVQDQDTEVMQVYVRAESTSAVATASNPKEGTPLAFAEGVKTGYVSINATIDEEAIDALTQYTSKSFVLDVCGYPYTFQFVKQDA